MPIFQEIGFSSSLPEDQWDRVFFDTDRIFRFTVYADNPYPEDIAAGEYRSAHHGHQIGDALVLEDVTGKSIGWTLRKQPNSITALIEKTTDTGGVTIVGVFGSSPPSQFVEVRLEDTDTYNPTASPPVHIKAGKYHHALKCLDPGTEGILSYGPFLLSQAAAWEA